ncbi:MAG: type II secretion system secretin GspD [Acidobacteria bacterium]|nr:type II secretion system secretin GspD [Acidobacteriota bacterium]
MTNRKLLIPAMIFLLALAAGSLSAVQQAQESERQMTPEERRKLFERLVEQMQQQKAPGPQTPQPAAPAASPAPQGVPAIAQRAPVAGGQVQLSYDNADLYEFINQITDTLGISPVIVDAEVKGSVTIHSSTPMSREDVFPLFNLILKNNNAAMVRQGNIYQIVPISSAIRKGLEIVEQLPPAPPEAPAEKAPEPAAGDKQTPEAKPTPSQPAPVPKPPPAGHSPQALPTPAPPAAGPQEQPKTEADSKTPQLKTYVIRVEFVPVRDLIEPLKLFMTEGGVIMPYERLNMMIVTDYSDSVSKLMEVVRMLDSSYLDPDLIELIKINYNAAADVLEDLRKIFGSGTKDSATGVYFVSLDRMNAILVMANSKRALAEVKRWIGELDATTGRTIQTFVYTVENGTASNIAMIIGALFGGEGTQTGGTTGVTGAVAPGGRATPFGAQTGTVGESIRTGGAFGSQAAGGTFGTGGFGAGTYGAGTYGGAFGSPWGGGGFGGYGGFGGGYGGFGGGVWGGGTQLGPRLNQGGGMYATVLRGGGFTGLQDAVRLVVDEINNTLIIQSSAADYAYLLETIKKLDIMPRQAVIDARIFEVDLTDALSFGVSATLQGRTGDQRLTTASLDGDSGALSAGMFAFIGNSRELLMAIAALRTKTKVRILEAPSVLALDGTMAKIVVGGEVPYPSASFIPSTGGATTSVQYRETGIQLLVMPRISASGVVTLDIAQEVSAPGAQTDQGPTFSKTSVSTTLAVRDGETVAIAGLIRDNTSQGRQGIPFVSNIPLIGALFGRTSRSANRTELLIMLTPHVIRTPERLKEMSQELKDSLRNVRKWADDKEKEHQEDLNDAMKDRIKKEQREQRKAEKQKAEAQM